MRGGCHRYGLIESTRCVTARPREWKETSQRRLEIIRKPPGPPLTERRRYTPFAASASTRIRGVVGFHSLFLAPLPVAIPCRPLVPEGTAGDPGTHPPPP